MNIWADSGYVELSTSTSYCTRWRAWAVALLLAAVALVTFWPVTGNDFINYDDLFPHVDARGWFVGKAAHIQATAFRNGSLQGAYLIIAARALGLDCGAMSGFDNHKVDEAFFAGTPIRSNFLVNLGHGDPEKAHKRNPRPSFDDVCTIV